jgi:hypothetical protein
LLGIKIQTKVKININYRLTVSKKETQKAHSQQYNKRIQTSKENA